MVSMSCACFGYNAFIMGKENSSWSGTTAVTLNANNLEIVTSTTSTVPSQITPSPLPDQEDFGSKSFTCNVRSGNPDSLGPCLSGINIQTKATFKNKSLDLIYNGMTTNCTFLDQRPFTPPNPPVQIVYLFSCNKYQKVLIIQSIGATGYVFGYINQPASLNWFLSRCPDDKIYKYTISANARKLNVALANTIACS